jgi:alpha-tubulin suppressor-like RCC1 family protein
MILLKIGLPSRFFKKALLFTAVILGLVSLIPWTTAAAADGTATTTTLSSSAIISVYGQSVTLTANVNSSGGNPSGSVTFKDGTATLGTVTLDDSGVASYSISTLSVGSHSIKAYYASSSTAFTDSNSPTLTQTVNKADTSITVASSDITSGYQSSVIFNATVTVTGSGSGTPTGTVTFKDGDTTLGTKTLSSGTATYTTSSLAIGNHTITAEYSGSTNYNSSTSSSISQVVTEALAISTVAMRPGFMGMAYTQTLKATGGSGPYTWSKSGTLPAGLSLSSSSGKISGTPNKKGEYKFTVRATDGASATASQSLTIVVRDAGYLYDWGDNTYGQLGIGSTTDRYVPVQTTELDDDNIIAAAAGGFHSLAINGDGDVYAWGYNNSGQLGNNTSTTEKEPVLTDDINRVIAVAAGYDHSLALDKNGNVYAWGDNAYGQLGIGSTTDKKVPTQIDDLDDIVAISAGYYHSLALKADGTVWAWGYNNKGQLGIGSTSTAKTPVQVLGKGGSGYLTGIVAISAGYNFNLALDKDGNIWAWGDNSKGQLGNGSTTTSKTPVQVSKIDDIAAIAAGNLHSLAMDSDGNVFAWGDNSYGQLGVGSTTTYKIPTSVNDISDITSIAAGNSHSLAIDDSGDVYAWGYNNKGQLGLGSTTTYKSPQKVGRLDQNTILIVANANNSMAISSEEIAVTPVSITTTSISDGMVGESYNQTLKAEGGSGDYYWSKSSGTLPAGLSLSSGGEISGTPTKSGEFTFTVEIVDASDSSSYYTRPFTVTIVKSNKSISITTTSLDDGMAGDDYSQTLEAEGGSGDYKWSKSSGTLPAGLSLSSGGEISGTPTKSGEFTFTVKAIDTKDSSLYDTRSFTITIDSYGEPASITVNSLDNGIVGDDYSQTLEAEGGSGDFTWSRSSGTLPVGLSLSSDGKISGTPTKAGTYTFTVKAIDVNDSSLYTIQSFTVTIEAEPTPTGTTKPTSPGGQVQPSEQQPLPSSQGQPISTINWWLTIGIAVAIVVVLMIIRMIFRKNKPE